MRTLCLQEILARKQAAIAALRRDVARECKVGGLGVSRGWERGSKKWKSQSVTELRDVPQEYDELLRGCKERLTELTVPLHDFPFRSSEQILDG